MTNSTQLFLDRFAIGLSLLCAVHCMALPIMLIAAPSLIATFQPTDHIFHEALLWLAIPTSFIAVFLGCKRHENQHVVIFAGIGITTLTATTLFGHDILGETGEKLTTLFAVTILAYAHWRNYTLCRQDECKH